ncbi:MAG: acyl-CoA dehydratase activase [Caloramator sp.]|nr:acyl-CoA dehydratase activase [Caloramator sp.]
MYLGIDVGSVSTDIVVLDEGLNVINKLYLRTKGRPIKVIQEGLLHLSKFYKDNDIKGVGTTGSGRYLAKVLVGADIAKNEITSHAVAAINLDKEVRTIIEIGGQDSKIITIDNGVVTDFAMNTVCAAGTGSFLDRQAERLEIPIEKFGEYALKSSNPVRIAGRCAVFAESDMIHKQQLGYDVSDIIAGLCSALARNFISNVAKGKNIRPKVFFQGGVAANIGMKKAFEELLNMEVFVPEHYDVMGAIGAAILAKEQIDLGQKTSFRGFGIYNTLIKPNTFKCNGCSNMCEVVELKEGEIKIGYFGDKCGRWSRIAV